MRRLGLVLAWFAVAFMMTTLAWQAVQAAGSQVNDQPLQPLVAATEDTVTGPSRSTTTRPVASTTAASARTSTATTAPGASDTTTTTTVSGSTSTTQAATTTAPTTSTPPTTTAPSEFVTTTYTLIGGTVTIRSRPEEVWLVAAFPAAGFAQGNHETGPSEVDVRFESTSHTSEFNAEWESGMLDVELEEEPEG